MSLDSARDYLCVGNQSVGVQVFHDASDANGPPVSGRSILLPSPILRLAVDTVNDRLYAAGSSALYIVPGISTVAPGTVNATAALAGPGSSFTAVAVRP